MKMEKRTFELDSLRIERRSEDAGGGAVLRGHAAVFDKWSFDLGGFREKIAMGAFAQAVKEDDVRALWNHDSSIILGRTKSGTLRLSEDRQGLAIEVDLPATRLIEDMMVGPVERGDVDQMSFAFGTRKDSWEEFPDKPERLAERTLLDVSLSDVSPVTYPAYPDTDVAVAMRSLDVWRNEHAPAAPDIIEEWEQQQAEMRQRLTEAML